MRDKEIDREKQRSTIRANNDEHRDVQRVRGKTSIRDDARDKSRSRSRNRNHGSRDRNRY